MRNHNSVGTTWLEHEGCYYLIEVLRERLIFPDLKRRVVAEAERHAADAVLIEDTGSGSPLIQELQREGPIKPIAITPEGDKVTRMLALLLGVLFFSIFPAFSNAALAHTSASRGALVMSLMPVTTLTLSVLLGEETLSRMKIAGVFSAIAGVAVALGDRASLPNEPGAWIGDLLMGAAIMIGTIYSVFLRRYLGRYSALVLTAFGMMIGVIIMAIMAGIFEGFFTQAPRLSRSGWLAILFRGVGAAAIGFFLWNWALEHTTATRVTVCLSLNPVAALALAVPLLNEPLTIDLIAGMMLVVLGIVLTNWGGGSKARTASPVGDATGHD